MPMTSSAATDSKAALLATIGEARAVYVLEPLGWVDSRMVRMVEYDFLRVVDGRSATV